MLYYIFINLFFAADDKKERERQLVHAEMIPTTATHLSFWEKFLELQYKMLFTSQEYVQNHMFSSEPLEWPFLTRGIAYWVSSESNVINLCSINLFLFIYDILILFTQPISGSSSSNW